MPHIVYKIETELETNERWIAEIIDVPGVLAYGRRKKKLSAPLKLWRCASSLIAIEQ